MRAPSFGLIALAFIGGCPMCDCESKIALVGRDHSAIAADEVVQFRVDSEGWESGPGHCGGYWYVNGYDGGDGSIGTIDSCGLYRAPPEWPSQLTLLKFEAADRSLAGGCADCCPYAYLDLAIAR